MYHNGDILLRVFVSKIIYISIGKDRAGYFIRQHIIPTQDEPDIKFWNNVISEIDKIDFSGKSVSK